MKRDFARIHFSTGVERPEYIRASARLCAFREILIQRHGFRLWKLEPAEVLHIYRASVSRTENFYTPDEA